MGFMNERQANKQAKNNLKKNQNYSRFPLTNDDNYIIMANMTNNNKKCFERLQMKKRTKLMTVVVAVGTIAQLTISAIAMSLPIWSTILLCKMASQQ